MQIDIFTATSTLALDIQYFRWAIQKPAHTAFPLGELRTTGHLTHVRNMQEIYGLDSCPWTAGVPKSNHSEVQDKCWVGRSHWDIVYRSLPL